VSATLGWLRRQLPGFVALALVVTTFWVGRLPESSAAETNALASGYSFTAMDIAMPTGYTQKTIRKVNEEYKHVDAWISSVGAAIAMNDLDGDGLSNDLCITDPRIDRVVISPAPGAGEHRYQPFALEAGSLPMNDVMAPMGCVPGDYNEDGRMDLLVYLWGRTPIVHLARTNVTGLSAAAYEAVEAVPGPNSRDGVYTGAQWNTNAVAVDDFDGDGHVDAYIGNYFPQSPVLDPNVDSGVSLNASMSHALNGGEDYMLRFAGGSAGAHPSVTFQTFDNAVPRDASKGWALAAAANDLDGDQLPELYLAHDFGPDRLLHNLSTPGHFKFKMVEGQRGPLDPKSKVVGHDSFKGMGVDFGDLNHDGLYDMFVSNITASWGIEESHFAFVSTAKDKADLAAKLGLGEAPWKDKSAPLGLNWTGWGWDVKLADFNNSGELVVAQTTGFVKGDTDRWPQLQELATANDDLLDNPAWWPKIRAGADVAGNNRLAFFVKGSDNGGRYVDIADELGLAVPIPTRGIATGDTDGDGRLDFAVARQWGPPMFYHNDSPNPGAFLGLRLCHDEAAVPGGMPAAGSPVVGAQATVTTPDGRVYVARVDGGGGHGGKRSSEVHIGLGQYNGPVDVHLQWRDRDGEVHTQDLHMTTGWHTLQLGSQAKER
jgi:hypothetical protein